MVPLHPACLHSHPISILHPAVSDLSQTHFNNCFTLQCSLILNSCMASSCDLLPPHLFLLSSPLHSHWHSCHPWLPCASEGPLHSLLWQFLGFLLSFGLNSNMIPSERMPSQPRQSETLTSPTLPLHPILFFLVIFNYLCSYIVLSLLFPSLPLPLRTGTLILFAILFPEPQQEPGQRKVPSK